MSAVLAVNVLLVDDGITVVHVAGDELPEPLARQVGAHAFVDGVHPYPEPEPTPEPAKMPVKAPAK